MADSPLTAESGAITDALAEHRWTNRSRCECGWTVRPCIFPEPQVGGLVQFEAHVAEHVAKALVADGWRHHPHLSDALSIPPEVASGPCTYCARLVGPGGTCPHTPITHGSTGGAS